MKKVYIENNLKKNDLKVLLDQMKSQCDSFSIVRYYEGNMSEQEFQDMQNAFKNMITGEHKQRIFNYQNNIDGYRDELNQLFHFDSELNAMEYFEELLQQELDIYNNYQYCEFQGYEDQQLQVPTEWLLKRELTRMTTVTIGPVFELLTLSMLAFDEVTSTMKKLFSSYKVFGDEFEDLCFYCHGKVVLKICSHENFAVLYDDET